MSTVSVTMDVRTSFMREERKSLCIAVILTVSRSGSKYGADLGQMHLQMLQGEHIPALDVMQVDPSPSFGTRCLWVCVGEPHVGPAWPRNWSAHVESSSRH